MSVSQLTEAVELASERVDRPTELGMLPKEWTVRPLVTVLEKIIDYRGRTPRKLGMEWGGGDIPALSARNVKMGFIDFDEETYYGSETLYRRWMMNGDAGKGDVVITTEAPLGNVAAIPDDRKYILSQRTILLKPASDLVSGEFLLHWLASDFFQTRLVENATGSTATGIQRRRIEKLPVPIPRIEEQRKIAAALSDADSLIGALDKLIDKKRAVRLAAAQSLLTGRTRLPGFAPRHSRTVQTSIGPVPADWKLARLGEIGECLIGLTFSPEAVTDDGLFVLRASNIGEAGLQFEDKLCVNMAVPQRLLLRSGDLLICVRNGSRQLIGKCALVDSRAEGMTFGAFMSVFRSTRNCFIFHFFQSNPMKRQIHEHLGATINQITNKSLTSFKIALPNEDEQDAIATVLSDFDAEIAVLEQRREKTKVIKQGMMQELLTGRTRLL